MIGKAIYMPKGAAGEYAKYACNFYKGCSNGCSYCYLKRGILAKGLGGSVPVLKACFKDKDDALAAFIKAIDKDNADLKRHGIFFTFTSDPCLPETIDLNFRAIYLAINNEIPVRILTKSVIMLDYNTFPSQVLSTKEAREYLSVGFTLTGRDDMEPNASTNAERIKAMERIHAMGVGTWASIEPVIDIEASKRCIMDSVGFCHEYKIGLLSGGKRAYGKDDVLRFFEWVEVAALKYGFNPHWKESVLKLIRNQK
ncbi:MAG: hypothetical protein NC324_02630 [Bacteroides sp.]|nr:hypothetical protein [Bacteroides sp.]